MTKAYAAPGGGAGLTRWVRAGAALALILAVAAVRGNWVAYRESIAIDYYQFWLVGQSAREVPDPYSEASRHALGEAGLRLARENGSPGQRASAERRRVFDTTATPFLYAVFGAISSGDYELDYALFRLVSIACTVIGILLVTSLHRWRLDSALLALATALSLASPFASDSAVGNVNQMQLGALAVVLALVAAEGRRWAGPASGFVAALLVLFKPNLALAELLLVAGFLIRGRHRFAAMHVAGAAVAALLGVVASSVAFGSLAVWGSWLHALATLDRGPPLPLSLGNVSLGRLLPGTARTGLVLVLTAATVAAAWVGRRRGRDFDASLAMAGAGVCIPLVLAALSWVHYFVLATPFVLAFLRPSGRPRSLALASIAAAASMWLVPGLVAGHPELVAAAFDAGALLLLAVCCGALAGVWSSPAQRERLPEHDENAAREKGKGGPDQRSESALGLHHRRRQAGDATITGSRR